MPRLLKTNVKICGLSDHASIACAIDGGASHIGFIFFEKSPRNVSPELAGDLVKPFRNDAACVAVSVNASDAFLDNIVETMRPNILQLHGHETPERVSQIKERFGLPVMKAFAIRQAVDFNHATDYIGVADRLLFDAKPPAGSELPGGNGVSFDWELFSNWQENYIQQGSQDGNGELEYPMLSGGVNLNNIDDALHGSNARAIDLSSGVETAPGVKDPTLISALLKQVEKIENGRALS